MEMRVKLEGATTVHGRTVEVFPKRVDQAESAMIGGDNGSSSMACSWQSTAAANSPLAP